METSNTSTDQLFEPTTDPLVIQTRYVALWNEPDRVRRYRMIDELFTSDIVHRLAPPIEIRDTARALGFPNPTLDIVGRIDMRVRVDRAYEEFIHPGQYSFGAAGTPQRIGSLVKVDWDMIENATHEVVGGGTDILEMTTDGLISADHQFVR